MSNKDNGGPAFPIPGLQDDADFNGMTLRDYFAAKAMAALMPIYWEAQDEYESGKALMERQVKSAYEYADAMLEARNQ